MCDQYAVGIIPFPHGDVDHETVWDHPQWVESYTTCSLDIFSIPFAYSFFVYIILIIIIALKGAIRDFLQSPHCAANCLQHVGSSGPGAILCKSHATHRALITCKPAVCYLVRGGNSSIKFDRAENGIYLSFILLAETTWSAP